MQVSVVIPAFNSQDSISAAVESALREPETYEVIVCDDGSDDATRDVVLSIPEERVRPLELRHSGNPARVRNAGIEAAVCPAIAFLDADDVWIQGKLRRQVAILANCPEVAFVCTNAFRQQAPDQEIESMEPLIDRATAQRESSLEALLADNLVVTSSVLARRDALIDAGLFNVADDVRGVEDYDLWLRLAARSRFVYLDEPWLVYRDWGASYRDTISAIVTCNNLLNMLARFEQAFPSTAALHKSVIRDRRARVLAEMSYVARMVGHRRLAVSAAARALAQKPTAVAAWKRFAAAILSL